MYILEHLFQLAENYSCTGIVIKDVLSVGALSVLGELLFNKRFESKLTFEMNIDFSNFTEESFHVSLRKSSKIQVNWGKKLLKQFLLIKIILRFLDLKNFKNSIIKFLVVKPDQMKLGNSSIK